MSRPAGRTASGPLPARTARPRAATIAREPGSPAAEYERHPGRTPSDPVGRFRPGRSPRADRAAGPLPAPPPRWRGRTDRRLEREASRPWPRAGKEKSKIRQMQKFARTWRSGTGACHFFAHAPQGCQPNRRDRRGGHGKGQITDRERAGSTPARRRPPARRARTSSRAGCFSNGGPRNPAPQRANRSDRRVRGKPWPAPCRNTSPCGKHGPESG